jgi:hypothetical protein
MNNHISDFDGLVAWAHTWLGETELHGRSHEDVVIGWACHFIANEMISNNEVGVVSQWLREGVEAMTKEDVTNLIRDNWCDEYIKGNIETPDDFQDFLDRELNEYFFGLRK